MAFSLTFPSSDPVPHTQDLATWLTEQGEAFEREGPHTLRLKAVPVRVVTDPQAASMQAQLEMTVDAPLSRIVDLFFNLSMRAGADVRLAGEGAVSRPQLWLSLAEDQSRHRLARSLERSMERSNAHEIHTRLWAVVGALRPGRDARWDAKRETIVEVLEVGAPEGISLEEASWHAESPQVGDMVGVPVKGHLHMVAWAWLQEAFPGLVHP